MSELYPNDEKSSLLQLKNDDQKAFEHLYQLYSPRIYEDTQAYKIGSHCRRVVAGHLCEGLGKAAPYQRRASVQGMVVPRRRKRSLHVLP